MSYQLNQNQITHIQNLKASGQYDLAYTYIAEQINSAVQNNQVSRETQRWFEWASKINANDGSFISDYAHNYAKLGAAADGKILTDADFQRGSDRIATEVLGVLPPYN